MAHKNKVFRSINDFAQIHCVDIVQAPDGRFGYVHCRRDPEDGHGWRIIGPVSPLAFSSAQAAFDAACADVAWLAEETGKML